MKAFVAVRRQSRSKAENDHQALTKLDVGTRPSGLESRSGLAFPTSATDVADGKGMTKVSNVRGFFPNSGGFFIVGRRDRRYFDNLPAAGDGICSQMPWLSSVT